MIQQEIIPHLFRTEYRKIISVLCSTFGIGHIEIAEDIVSDTFLTASETWAMKGLPENPVAWLYTVAKNNTRNYLKHTNLFDNKISGHLTSDTKASYEQDLDLSAHSIKESQLQMLFTICHPAISTEAQISLALRLLCGFGIGEIADAFFIPKETVTKRIYRAKETLKEKGFKIAMPTPTEIDERLNVVLQTLYLMFNEGYYSTSNKNVLRKDLCLEALRLTHQLTENTLTDQPAVNALLALMSYQVSRFDARVDNNGELVIYDEQDETLWDKNLIEQGNYYLNKASIGHQLSKYHLEAAIAYWHTRKEDTPQKWESILYLYNCLLSLNYSQTAALNRTYALYKFNGAGMAIAEAEKLNLAGNYLYYALLGELYKTTDPAIAKQHLEKAITMAKTDQEKQALRKRLANIVV